jgi:nicotinamidase-related amidase
MAHVCVSTTAGAGVELGYDVILAEDAIGDRDIPGAKADEVVKMVMTELGNAFGTVVKSNSIE